MADTVRVRHDVWVALRVASARLGCTVTDLMSRIAAGDINAYDELREAAKEEDKRKK